MDKGTGYRTRNILCMPITTRNGNKVGVMEILNKKKGPFSATDQRRLAALCAQAAVSIENAQLFEDVSNSRNYNESILRSMSNGVLTLDAANTISKVNPSALRILRRPESELLNCKLSDVFSGPNSWVTNSLEKVLRTGRIDNTVDSDLVLDGQQAVSVNMMAVPLQDMRDDRIGSMLIMEDITREKRVRDTMSRYMSKAVMDELLEGGEAVLGGTNREVSVLFSDIRGFTAMSERLGARETVAMLNDYFTDMVDVVFAHNGILDKYIGDMIMAVFGSVRSTREDAANAVTVGNRMMMALRELNARRSKAGHELIRIGIGISTGDVVAGSIGSPKRLEYTVIGDRVNLAERLQNANKVYGTSVLICESTAARLRGSVRLRDLDLIRVRGMRAPVPICEVLDHHTQESFPRIDEVVQAFGEGVVHYRKQSWAQAAAAFSAALAAHPVIARRACIWIAARSTGRPLRPASGMGSGLCRRTDLSRRGSAKSEIHRGLAARYPVGDGSAGAAGLRPAQRAVSGVEIQVGVARAADVRDVRRRRRTQPRPQLRMIDVACAGEQLINAAQDGGAARRIGRGVVAGEFRGAGNAQAPAQP